MPAKAQSELDESVVKYISFGCGVQSTALVIMSALELFSCPKATLAVFADTMDEPIWVYEHLDRMKVWCKDHGLPIHVVSRGSLSANAIDSRMNKSSRFACVPAFTQGKHGREAMLRRQCTREYKIEVIEKFIRDQLGYKKGERVKERVTALLGISLDEATRMKDSRTKWIENKFPLVDARFRRSDCIDLISRIGLPIPKKSSCVFCPYHSDRYWLDLKRNYPKEFERAIRFDEIIRNMSRSQLRNPIFIHRSLKPLALADLNEGQGEFWTGEDEPAFNNECEGHCGT